MKRLLLLVLLILPLSALSADREGVCFYSSTYGVADRTFKARLVATAMVDPHKLATLQVFKAVELDSVDEVEGTPLSEMLDSEQVILTYREVTKNGKMVLRTRSHAHRVGKDSGAVSIILGAGLEWEPVPQIGSQFEVITIYGRSTMVQELDGGDDQACFLPL